MVGVLALVVAITATTIRRYFERVNVIRDALGESPLAYAEFSFPGYKLLNNNQTFDLLAQGRSRPGALPHELMDKRAAEEMAAAMDEAVNTRRRVYRAEFQILSAEGQSKFWGMNFIPILQQKRGTPRAMTLFALELTEAVTRDGTREAA